MEHIMNIEAVETLYNHYHEKVKKYPDLYIGDVSITICLPEALKEYCNAAAGHAAGIPIGIRFPCNNPEETIKEIFSSIKSLQNFIESSECNSNANLVSKKKPKESIRKLFWENYTKEDLEAIKKKYDYASIKAAFNSDMTLDEFKLQFDMH
jgi:hypothetical protein